MLEFKRPIPLQFNDKGFLEKHTSMQKQEPKRVLAVVSDLFFSVKLSEAAKRNGLALEFVKEGKEVLEKAKAKPTLIVFDLNFETVSPACADRQTEGQHRDQRHQPDRLSFAHTGRVEDPGAGSRVRHGDRTLRAIAEYAADLQAPFRHLTGREFRLSPPGTPIP